MIFGRILGFLFLIFASVTAFSEAVLALNSVEYQKVIVADVLTLLSGNNVVPATTIHELPVWIVFAFIGFVLTYFCSKKKSKYRSSFN